MRVRSVAVAVVAVAAAAAALLAFGRGGGHPTAKDPPRAQLASATHRHAQRPLHLVARSAGRLGSPLQDAAGASVGHGHALLLGGLTAGDVSSADEHVVAARSDSLLGRLPTALHDAAAVTLGGSVYLFGGGDGTTQHDEILRVDPVSGRTALVGRLPAVSSDQAAAAIGGTAYVVGGYTGSRWLDTIVAWRPGSRPRVVAHLPTAVRYAAVTSVGATLVVAGGSLPEGTASAAVFAYRAGRVTRLGSLPAPTTHAAAAALGGEAIVVGGRGASVGTPTTRIVAVDPAHRRVRSAGVLATPLSDATVVGLGSSILVAGGRGPAGTVADLSLLVRGPRTRATSSPPARIPAAVSASNVYAADGANMLTGAARHALPRIYVPNSRSGTVDVIDPATRKIVEHFAVGALPQHVTPSYDLKTLYVLNDQGNSLTVIDPRTGRPGRTIPVDDPYNMYFTPDGRYAIVVAERLHRLDFRDAHTFALHRSIVTPCTGVDHMDFSADGRYAIASCEFSGQLLKLNVARERVVAAMQLPGGRGMPQDVKLSPDGRVFYVADMMANGLWEVDGRRFKIIGFLPTGRGVHGLYPSRDAKLLYATNRGEGSISVISFRTRKVVAKWWIPGGGSPDMGGVSADGKVLWLSGRYSGVVYAISTANGRLLARIPVGSGPHGLCVWPQPGRYSLGHTGILR